MNLDSTKLKKEQPEALVAQDILWAAEHLAHASTKNKKILDRRILIFCARYGLHEKTFSAADEGGSEAQKATLQEVAEAAGITRQGVHTAMLTLLGQNEILQDHQPPGYLALVDSLNKTDAERTMRLLKGIGMRNALLFYAQVYGMDLPIQKVVKIDPQSIRDLRVAMQRLVETNGAAHLNDLSSMLGTPGTQVAELLDKMDSSAAKLQAQVLQSPRAETLEGFISVTPGWYTMDKPQPIPWHNRYLNAAFKILQAAQLTGVQSLELGVLSEAAYRAVAPNKVKDEEEVMTPRTRLPDRVAIEVLRIPGHGRFEIKSDHGVVRVQLSDQSIAEASQKKNNGLTQCEHDAILALHEKGGSLSYKDIINLLVGLGHGKPLAGKVLQHSFLFKIIKRGVRGLAWTPEGRVRVPQASKPSRPKRHAGTGPKVKVAKAARPAGEGKETQAPSQAA